MLSRPVHWNLQQHNINISLNVKILSYIIIETTRRVKSVGVQDEICSGNE